MDTIPAYQFDYSGHYSGATEADESPLEPGVFLLPGRCTLTPPPEEIPDDKWPRWNGTAWDLVNRPQPVAADPAEKLREFLAANPDVAKLIGS